MATKQRTARKPKPEKLSRRDSAEYLRGEADIEAYFEAAIDEAGDDPVYMLHVLNTIARAARGGLYKALAPDAKSSVQTVAKIAKALGFRLTLERAA